MSIEANESVRISILYVASPLTELLCMPSLFEDTLRYYKEIDWSSMIEKAFRDFECRVLVSRAEECVQCQSAAAIVEITGVEGQILSTRRALRPWNCNWARNWEVCLQPKFRQSEWN